MPKLLSYITLWGTTDLKNDETGEVVDSNRLVHSMTTTNVRDEDLNLLTSIEEEQSEYNVRNVQKHVILPPQENQANFRPVL